MMCPATDNLASCEIRAVIRLLHAKNMSTAEIRRELCATIYVQTAISKGIVKQRWRMFRDGRRDVGDEERSGRPDFYSE
jgi:hypothetical protein